MDRETNKLLRSSLQHLLSSHPVDIARALADFGWADAVNEDQAAAVTALFEEQGESLESTAALDAMAAGVLGLPENTSVVWPHPSRGPAPAAVRSGDGLEVLGLVLAPSRWRLNQAVVGTEHGVIELSSENLREVPLGGIDRRTGWIIVEGVIELASPIGSWAGLVGPSQLAVASEIIGVSRRALDVACEHVRTREQFGRPIGSYQSVRHRLAEAYCALVGAQALVAAAWQDGSSRAAGAAKAAAGAAHDVITREAIQVCGGMGLSDEHVLPRLVRRGLLLDAFLGSSRDLVCEEGALLLTDGEPHRVGSF